MSHWANCDITNEGDETKYTLHLLQRKWHRLDKFYLLKYTLDGKIKWKLACDKLTISEKVWPKKARKHQSLHGSFASGAFGVYFHSFFLQHSSHSPFDEDVNLIHRLFTCWITGPAWWQLHLPQVDTLVIVWSFFRPEQLSATRLPKKAIHHSHCTCCRDAVSSIDEFIISTTSYWRITSSAKRSTCTRNNLVVKHCPFTGSNCLVTFSLHFSCGAQFSATQWAISKNSREILNEQALMVGHLMALRMKVPIHSSHKKVSFARCNQIARVKWTGTESICIRKPHRS